MHLNDLTLQVRLSAKEGDDRVFLLHWNARVHKPFDSPAVEFRKAGQFERGDLPLAGLHEADGGPL